MTIEDAARLAGVDLARGLGESTAAARLAEIGPNVITRRERTTAWMSFLRQFRQPLIYILVLASLVAGILGQTVDSVVILVVVLVNAAVGAVQERKAGHTIAALSRLLRTEVFVRRDGRRGLIDSAWLVPGDVVLLQAGNRVPADMRLTSGRSLQIDESGLTGESRPVPKNYNPLGDETPLPDRSNVAFAGTLVVAGHGEGIVWATGDRTETGRIAHLIETMEPEVTPLMRKIAEFSRMLLWIIAALAALAFAVGWARSENLVDIFIAAVAIAVAAIPEGLPAAVTIVLAIGASRMAARRAIIRSLPAVETLGSATVICTDKTGTLTENAMTVRRIFAGGHDYEVMGQGYEPRGEILLAGEAVSIARHAALAECLKAGLLCNESRLVNVDGQWKCEGDPTEAALAVAAHKAGITVDATTRTHRRIDTLPFSPESQFMATLHESSAGGVRMVYKKGSAERLLARCVDRLDDHGKRVSLDRASISAAVDRLASEGLRVLALARTEFSESSSRLEERHVAHGLTFLGLQAMWDPPRPEAAAAVRHCRDAGIVVKMVTGDHLGTAREIARRMCLDDEPICALSGKELEGLSEEELATAVEKAAVFARVTAEQKLHLVRALQAHGHVVAMTGDGVNDAPALKQADIGVAMGRGGTEVARMAADMVLTDDNFASIEAAVEEGRSVFDNLAKFIVWTIPTNVAESLALLCAVLLGTTLPILPTQLLWINLATASLLGITLAFEVKDPGLMQRAPRDTSHPILTSALLVRTALVSTLIVLGAFGAFLWELARGVSPEAGRTTVVNVIVCVEAFYLVNCRSLSKPAHRLGAFSNPWLVAGIVAMAGVQLAFTYLPMMNTAFHSRPIDLQAWGLVMAMGFTVFVVVNLEKRLRRSADG